MCAQPSGIYCEVILSAASVKHAICVTLIPMLSVQGEPAGITVLFSIPLAWLELADEILVLS